MRERALAHRTQYRGVAIMRVNNKVKTKRPEYTPQCQGGGNIKVTTGSTGNKKNILSNLGQMNET